jgi:hypothetical protein
LDEDIEQSLLLDELIDKFSEVLKDKEDSLLVDELDESFK